MGDGMLEENCNQVSNIPTMTSLRLQLEYKCTASRMEPLGVMPAKVLHPSLCTSPLSIYELNMTNEVRILISREIMPRFEPICSLIKMKTDFSANIHELQ